MIRDREKMEEEGNEGKVRKGKRGEEAEGEKG